jgi:tetratricopeptide (TPR) repeat protein
VSRIRLWPQRSRLSPTGRWVIAAWYVGTLVCLCGLGVGLTAFTDQRFDQIVRVMLAGGTVLGLGGELGLQSHFTGSFKVPGARLQMGVVVAGLVLAAALFLLIPLPWSAAGAIPAIAGAYMLAARLTVPLGYWQALRCYRRRDFAGMQAILDRMKARRPNPHTYNLQGFLHLHLGDYQAALEAYRRVVELQPDLFHGHAGLTDALIRLGHYDEAIQAARHMHELAPNLGVADYALGKALYWRGDWLEASAHLADALERDLKGPPYLLITHYMLLRCHQELGHPDKVAEHRAAVRRYRAGLAELARTNDDSAPTPYVERFREDLKAIEQLLEGQGENTPEHAGPGA